MLGDNTNKIVWIAVALGIVATLGAGTMVLFPGAFNDMKEVIVKKSDDFMSKGQSDSDSDTKSESATIKVNIESGSFPELDNSALQSIQSDYDSGSKSIDGVVLASRAGVANISNIKSDDAVWLQEINSELASSYAQNSDYHVYNPSTKQFDAKNDGYSDGVTNQLWMTSTNAVLNQDSSHKFKSVTFDLTMYYAIGSYDNGKDLPDDRTDNEYYYPVTVHVTVDAVSK